MSLRKYFNPCLFLLRACIADLEENILSDGITDEYISLAPLLNQLSGIDYSQYYHLTTLVLLLLILPRYGCQPR